MRAGKAASAAMTSRSALRARGAIAAIAFTALAALGPRADAWEAGADGLAPIPALATRVTDLTQTLSSGERAALEAKLADWEARTTNQLAVLLVPTTQPEPIEAYSIRVADAWKIGRKGNDNGVLLVVAKNDRKVRIEVGYGLEGTLTDATSRRIIAETIAPQFREGRFAAGIGAGIDRIIEVVAEGKPLPPPKAQATARRQGGLDLETLALAAFVAVPLVGVVLRAIFGRVLGATLGAGGVGFVAWLVAGSLAVAVVAALLTLVVMLFSGLTSSLNRRGGGVWTSGGGWGGGSGGGGISGGGGFSGGGGSFGGGGASGNW